MKQNPLSLQLNLDPADFLPATDEEKEAQIILRESVSFWKDGFRRLVKNKVAMVSIAVIVLVMIFSFIVPRFYPYSYEQQIKGANNLAPMQYSAQELKQIENGESVFRHSPSPVSLNRPLSPSLVYISKVHCKKLPAGHACRESVCRFIYDSMLRIMNMIIR